MPDRPFSLDYWGVFNLGMGGGMYSYRYVYCSSFEPCRERMDMGDEGKMRNAIFYLNTELNRGFVL